MTRIEDHTPPSEAVIWRWPGGPWARLRAGANLGQATRGEFWVLILGLPITLGVFLFSLPGRDATGEFLFLPILALLGGLVWLFGFMSFYVGYFRVSRLALTETRLRHSIGFPWSREASIPRTDIRYAVIYEGDGTVVLHGDNGELLRARHVAKASAFAEALGVPSVVWPVHKGMSNVGLMILLALIFNPVFFLCIFVAFTPAVYLVAPLSLLIEFGAGYFGWHAGSTLVLSMAMLAIAIAAIMAAPIAMFCMIAVARFLFKPETMRGLLYFLAVNPWLWSGKAPMFKQGWWHRLQARYINACARIVGAESPSPLQPELHNGATLDMAEAVQP